MKIELVIASGQYETASRRYETVASKYHITATTYKEFCRRVDQLKKSHSWAGWLKVDITIASPEDEWGGNCCLGGRWCNPKNGWIKEVQELDNRTKCMSYKDAWAVACAAAGVNV